MIVRFENHEVMQTGTKCSSYACKAFHMTGPHSMKRGQTLGAFHDEGGSVPCGMKCHWRAERPNCGKIVAIPGQTALARVAKHHICAAPPHKHRRRIGIARDQRGKG